MINLKTQHDAGNRTNSMHATSTRPTASKTEIRQKNWGKEKKDAIVKIGKKQAHGQNT